ncbi:MAG: hemolysin family protein [Oscillospiraceae bacterium]
MRLAKLTSKPARFLATIQVAITLSGFLGSAFAADNFSDKLVEWLLSLGVTVPVTTLDTAAVIVITLILSYFTLVFGELVPKRIAMKKAEALALGMSGLITAISKLFAPLVWLLTASTNGMLRLCGIDPNAEDEAVSEEEIRMMVDVGNQKGVIDLVEREMIQNVFEFDGLTVGEFATHRTELALLWMDETAEEWEKTIHESRHTLYPICDESVDHVIGILNIKDYFRLTDHARETVLQEAVKPAYFIPESVCADVLFAQMKNSHNHFAVVLDEYGGMAGIVTMNDLLEQLVGDLDDMADENAPSDLEQIDEQTWRVRGSVSLDEVAQALHIPLPTDDYDTFGGWVLGQYGFIPEDGTSFELNAGSLHIMVTKMKEHRIEEAILSIAE